MGRSIWKAVCKRKLLFWLQLVFSVPTIPPELFRQREDNCPDQWDSLSQNRPTLIALSPARIWILRMS